MQADHRLTKLGFIMVDSANGHRHNTLLLSRTLERVAITSSKTSRHTQFGADVGANDVSRKLLLYRLRWVVICLC